MEKEDEVFLDAQEEVTPRRSGRKRRSTTGSSSIAPVAVKKSKTKMPTQRSPKRDGPSQGSSASRPPQASEERIQAPPGSDQDAFWTKMSGLLGGMEARIKQETNQMREQLAVAVEAVGDLGTRMERAEKRLGGLSEEVNSLVDKRLSNLPPAPPSSRISSPPGLSYAAALGSKERGEPSTLEAHQEPC